MTALLTLAGVTTRNGLGPLSATVDAKADVTLPEGVVPVAIGLERAHSGAVTLLGQPLAGLHPEDCRALRAKVAVIGRDPVLLGNLDVRENVMLPLRYHKRYKEPQIERLVDLAFHEHGLTPLAAQRPHALTANQRRAIARVRALLTAPTLLFVVDDGTELDAQLCDDVRGRGGAIVHLRPGTA